MRGGDIDAALRCSCVAAVIHGDTHGAGLWWPLDAAGFCVAGATLGEIDESSTMAVALSHVWSRGTFEPLIVFNWVSGHIGSL